MRHRYKCTADVIPDGFKKGKVYLAEVKDNSVWVELNSHYTTVTTISFFDSHFLRKYNKVRK